MFFIFRWDEIPSNAASAPKKRMTWDQADTPSHTPGAQRWEETPGRLKGSETPGAIVTPGPSTRAWAETPSHMTPGATTPGRGTPAVGATPGGTPSMRKNRWDETPKTERETPGRSMGWAETPGRQDRGEDSIRDTPGASKRKSRWDLTPAAATPGNQTPSAATPVFTPGGTPTAFTPKSALNTPGGTPSMYTPSGVTPIGVKAMGLATPTPGQLMSMTPEQLQVSENYKFNLKN